MAATSRTEIDFERLWDLSNNAGVPHSTTSEIAGTIYSIENGSSSSGVGTSDQRARDLAQNKAHVIAWAKEQFPDLLNGGPERLYDPITCDLFTSPQTHQCNRVEHKLDSESFEKTRFLNKEKFTQAIRSLPQYRLIESVILRHFWRVDFYITHLEHLVTYGKRFFMDSPYAHIDLLRPGYPRDQDPYQATDAVMRDIRREDQLLQADRELRQIADHMATVDLDQYVIVQGLCPYTKTLFVDGLDDHQLQQEIYLFVLTRMGILNAPSSSSTSSEHAPPAEVPMTSTTQVTANPMRTLQNIGGVVSSLISEFTETGFHFNPRSLEHVDQMADYCPTCAAKAGRLPSSVVKNGYEDICKAIASLPEEIQSTLHYMIWERRGCADTSSDPLWGKNHLLSNLHRTLSVVRIAIREQTARPSG
ncbi:MAG: hypothetical protein V4492_08795 [Chlamydiota bacterium]